MYHIEFDLEFEKNPYRGKFIVVEGIDGSGKTTQANVLVKYLQSKSIETVYTKEPTDGVIGQLIRRVLAGEIFLPPVSFQYLFAADRAVHQMHLVEYLKKDFTVVSDRYFWSSAVYGMVDRGISSHEGDKERLFVALSILSMYHRFIVPDYTFYLRVSIEEALKRIGRTGRQREVYEKKEQLEKVRNGYEWLANNFEKEITVIDGEKSVGEATKEIVKSLKFLK